MFQGRDSGQANDILGKRGGGLTRLSIICQDWQRCSSGGQERSSGNVSSPGRMADHDIPLPRPFASFIRYENLSNSRFLHLVKYFALAAEQ